MSWKFVYFDAIIKNFILPFTALDVLPKKGTKNRKAENSLI